MAGAACGPLTRGPQAISDPPRGEPLTDHVADQHDESESIPLVGRGEREKPQREDN